MEKISILCLIVGLFALGWGLGLLASANLEAPVTARELVALFCAISGVFCLSTWALFKK